MNNPQQFSQFDNYEYPKRRRVWPWVLLVIGIIIIGFIGLFIAIIAGISSSFNSAFEKEAVKVEPKTVLMMDLSNVSEITMNAPFAFFDNENASYFELTKAIENAANDKNIAGIYYKASMVPIDAARAEGIKRAIEKFKKSGKFVYAFVEIGDESQYINALSADSIFMPQEGILELNGYSANSMFFKDFLQKIGMKYEVVQFEDFKSYGEMYSRTNFSDSAKYAIRILLNQRMDYLVRSISEKRNLSVEKIKADLDVGIFSAEEALQNGYIDKIISSTDMREFLKKKAGGKKLELMSLNKYATQANSNDAKGKVDENKKIAIVNAVGAINSGTMGNSPYSGNQGIYSGTFVKMLRKIREDKSIKAVILRISSPGGSVMASDEIYSEIEKLRSVKPVYASMADVAASGGYYIALPCDSIFAQDQTITGSIGVISVIPNFSGTIKLLGISNDTINTTKASSQLNLFKEFNPVDIARFKSYSSDVYKRFVMKTAKNRKMSFDQARALAKGRVWTGADAKQRGLIDGIADLSQVIDIVKKRLGVAEGTKVPLDIYPTKTDQFSDFLKSFGFNKNDDDEQQELSIKSILGTPDAKYDLIKENLPKEMQNQVMYMLDLTKMGQKEKVLMAMPAMLNVK